MIDLLVTLLIVVLISGLIYGVITLLPLPPPFKTAALVILAVILLVWLLHVVGWLGSGPPWRVRT